jgi:Ala-tRNA(Pro) deacylase
MSGGRSSVELTPTRAEAITAFLEGARVPFELLEHEPTTSARAEARALGRSSEMVARTVVLQDRGAYVIVAIPASDRLDLHRLRELLGAGRRLRLASEQQIARDFPSLEVGAVPPFGPMMPAAEVIDSALARQPRIVCPAGDHRHSVLVDPGELIRITGAIVADICEG